jgi:hypothetical protein
MRTGGSTPTACPLEDVLTTPRAPVRPCQADSGVGVMPAGSRARHDPWNGLGEEGVVGTIDHGQRR